MKRGLISGILLLFLINSAAGEIFLGQPASSLYNVGDIFNISVSLSSNTKIVDFFKGTLICNEDYIEIYKSLQSLNAGEKKEINIEISIVPSIIGNFSGECYLSVEYMEDVKESQRFEISNGVKVDFNIDGVAFSPEEKVKISGRAIKYNNELLNGFVNLVVDGIDVNINSGVKEGSFNLEFVVPDNAAPGSYVVKAIAYEKNELGERTNEGESTEIIKIRQILKDVRLEFNELSIIPGDNFKYKVLAYDQTGDEMREDVSIVIKKPSKDVFIKRLVKSGDENELSIEGNYTPGYWGINTFVEGMNASKLFLVEELEKAVFELVNNTLIVRNIGNIPYRKPVEISIGGISEVKEIDLPVGSDKVLRLSAPDGEYEIGVNDGIDLHQLGRTFLTGNAIGVGDIGEFIVSDLGVYIWGGLIVILLIIALILIRKVMKKSYIGKAPKLVAVSGKVTTPLGFKVKENEEGTQGTIIDRGIKQEAAIISLKIKNLQQLQKLVGIEGNPLEGVDRALLRAKSAGAKIYIDKDYRLVIFASTVTKERDNEIKSVNLAKEMEGVLSNYNKSSANKIEFGIGVHTGDLGIETREGQFKFVSLGNTIPIVKRISEISNGEVLLSEEMHKKTLGKVKVEKLVNGYYRVTRIMDRTDYEDFINRFMARQKNE